MKAAVMYPGNGLPQYVDIPEPVVQGGDEMLVTVKTVAIKHFDKARAAGTHYSSETANSEGRVIGGDGVCLLPNGVRVYGMGISGMLAEKAVIHKDRIVELPDGLDDATAAALPNAVAGAAMGLKFKADIQPGDVVLINGATGFTGQVAVQIARHYGAKKVIATGRNARALEQLLSLGADDKISLLQDDESFKAQLKAIHSATPVDVVVDYLWGHTAEMIFSCLKGNGGFTNKIRYVSVGSMAGDGITLSAASLRSVDLQLTGSGLGAWTKAQVAAFFGQMLPEMFRLAAAGKLKVETATVKLENIAEMWNMKTDGGQRLVVSI